MQGVKFHFPEVTGYGLSDRLSHDISPSLPSRLDAQVSVQVLHGEVRLRVREIIRQVCAEMGVTIINGALSRDHVHLFVEIPPPGLGQRLRPPGKGPLVTQNPAGVRAHSQALLGSTLLATRLVLDHVRQHHRWHRHAPSRPTYPKGRLPPLHLILTASAGQSFSRPDQHYSLCSALPSPRRSGCSESRGSFSADCRHPRKRFSTPIACRLWPPPRRVIACTVTLPVRIASRRMRP